MGETRPTEITVREDPVTGVWSFTLDGHQIEVARAHAFVKIDGHVHRIPEVANLTEVDDLAGTTLATITRLITRYHAPDADLELAPSPPLQSAEPAPAENGPEPQVEEALPARPAGKRRRAKKRRKTRPAKPLKLPQAPANPDGALPTQEAASYLGLSPATLSTKRTRGGGPPYRKLGRRVVYLRRDLDAWLEARTHKSTSDSGPGQS